MTEQLRQDIDAYNNAKHFMYQLTRTKGVTREEFIALKNKALRGNLEEAFHGLRAIIDRQEEKRA